MKKTKKLKPVKYNSAKMAKVQKIVDDRRLASVKDLSLKDKRKMEYTEKTLEEFRQRGIPVYIYPLLPIMSPTGKESIGCFNTITLEHLSKSRMMLSALRVN